MTRSPDERTLRSQVGRRLYLRRVWLGLVQQEVADKAGVSRNFVSAIERGAQGLDAWRLGLIADALDVALDWLLNGPDRNVTDAAPDTERSTRDSRTADHRHDLDAAGNELDTSPRESV